MSSQGDYQAGRDYFQETLVVFQEQGNQTGKGLALTNLGWVSGILGDYPAAMDYYERSLVITRQLGQHHEEMYTYFNLSASSYGQGLADEALDWAQRGLELASTIEDSSAQAWAYYYLGLAHILNDKFTEATEVLIKSVKIRVKAKTPVLIVEARASLAQAYAALNDQIAARREVEEVIQYIQKDKTLEGAEEPLRIYLSIYEWLQKTKDPRTSAILKNAKELMNTQVEKLRSEQARQRFVENVPWRRMLRDA